MSTTKPPWNASDISNSLALIYKVFLKNTTNGVRYFWFSDLYRNSDTSHAQTCIDISLV